MSRLRVIACWLLGHSWIVRHVKPSAGVIQLFGNGISATLILYRCNRCPNKWKVDQLAGSWRPAQLGVVPAWIPDTPPADLAREEIRP